MENTLFEELEVGMQVLSREFIRSTHWDKITVTEIEGDSVTFEDGEGMEIVSDKEEVNCDVYFRKIWPTNTKNKATLKTSSL